MCCVEWEWLCELLTLRKGFVRFTMKFVKSEDYVVIGLSRYLPRCRQTKKECVHPMIWCSSRWMWDSFPSEVLPQRRSWVTKKWGRPSPTLPPSAAPRWRSKPNRDCGGAGQWPPPWVTPPPPSEVRSVVGTASGGQNSVGTCGGIPPSQPSYRTLSLWLRWRSHWSS